MVVKKKSQTPKHAALRVQKLGSERPEARDEGPRLLPIQGEKGRLDFGRAVDLADVALGKRKSAHTAKPGSRDQSVRSTGPGRSSHA
jgi:hypothetical protein